MNHVLDLQWVGKAKQAGVDADYDGYLSVFQHLATATERFEVRFAPSCWAPFIWYLGHEVVDVVPRKEFGWTFERFDWLGLVSTAPDPRRVVEVASTTRPELVHALYLADTEWPCPMRRHHHVRAFDVTCNGSFFRPEVHEYLDRLDRFSPEPTRCIILPCSAVKPYPSPLHSAVKAIVPPWWHLVVATTTLGIVPEELWGWMPLYDAGVPNSERLVEIATRYFTRNVYDAVVVFSDFCAAPLRQAFDRVPVEPRHLRFLLGTHWRDDYANLRAREPLTSLVTAVYELDMMLKQEGEP